MLLLTPYNATAMRAGIEKADNEFLCVCVYLRLVTLQENLKCPEILQLKCERNFRKRIAQI